MSHDHESPTTHTLEMAQLAEINARLSAVPRPVVTAGDLALAATQAVPVGTGGSTAPRASAELVRITWDGPPDYPYVHGHFVGEGPLVVNLHTEALQQLSRHLHLHHVWGIGSLPRA